MANLIEVQIAGTTVITSGRVLQNVTMDSQLITSGNGTTLSAGDILYHDGTRLNRLAIGASGSFLAINTALAGKLAWSAGGGVSGYSGWSGWSGYAPVGSVQTQAEFVLGGAGGWPSTTSGCTGPTKAETTTNDVNTITLDFADAVTSYAEWTAFMPQSYNSSTFMASFVWTAAATGDVVWGIQAKCYSTTDALDAAFGTAQTTTSTIGSANTVIISGTTAAITPSGTLGATKMMQFKVYRQGGSGSDTLAATAKLISVRLVYGISGSAIVGQVSGVSGWSGYSGPSGISGPSGYSGYSASVGNISLTYIIDGGGSAITTGSKGYLEVPFACTVTGWTITSDTATGNITVDVKKCTYANFPTTSSIAGSEKPTLSSVQKNQDLSLSTWTTAISAGDILEFNVDSAATMKVVTVSIRATKP